MIISCDDGCSSDLRLAELAKKYDVECVFYLPVEWHTLNYGKQYEPLSYVDAYELAQHFEIGSHGITHRYLTKIPSNEARYEIEASKYMLQRLLNPALPITKFAPPRGYTNDSLTAFTEKFYEKQRLTKGSGLFHVHPDSGVNNNQHWLKAVEYEPVEELWMHSWELDRYDEWDNLERFLSERR